MFNKFILISAISTSLFASSVFAESSNEKLILQCSFGSREIEMPERRVDLNFDTGWNTFMGVEINPIASGAYSPDLNKFDRAEFGIYSILLSSNGNQGQLNIVDSSTKKDVFSILW